MATNITEKLRELGISPSVTRMSIYEYLESNKVHPTVDQIYQDLAEELPTLSKTTVYNVLNLFIEHHLVAIVNSPSNEKRYELLEMPHAHFICKECGTIYDIPEVMTSYNKNKLHGFLVEYEEVTMTGICPTCMSKQ